MAKLTVLRGLPGSGKSTIARDIVAAMGNTIRVNRDDLRKMMHGDLRWTPGREQAVAMVERAIVENELKLGFNVVLDNTHILGNGVERYRDIAIGLGCEFVLLDLTKLVPLKECIRRDENRTSLTRVGRGVIERMALFGGLIEFPDIPTAIVDIDGTLADLRHRLPYIQGEHKDYDQFFADVCLDTGFPRIVNAVREMKIEGYHIIVLSGRPTSCGHDTARWLDEGPGRNFRIIYDHLFMREAGDHRPDNEAKREIMDQMFKCGLKRENIKIVLDDRESVCAVWRNMDLPLAQVLEGKVILCHPEAIPEVAKFGLLVQSV